MKKNKGIIFGGVLVLSLVVFVFGKSFMALAGDLIDSFTDTSRVADTWQVEVDTAAGEVKLSARSCDSDVWVCDEADVCLNFSGDGEYILVASTSISSTKQWKTSNTNCDLPQCKLDGAQSGDDLCADNTIDYLDYPARQACQDLGGRLPTRTELQCMYQNQANFGDNFAEVDYLSSEESTSSGAWRVDFESGGVFADNKSTYFNVRCVRGW